MILLTLLDARLVNLNPACCKLDTLIMHLLESNILTIRIYKSENLGSFLTNTVGLLSFRASILVVNC